MTMGDAYIYCAIISKDQVERIYLINKEIEEIQKPIDAILKYIHDNPNKPDPKRGKRGLALMDKQDEKYDEIIRVCRNPIAFDLVADDIWHEAYEKCSQYNFRPVPVKEFLKGVQGKLWKDPAIFTKHENGYCICLPSHYDTDDEFLAELNIPNRHG